MPSPSRRRESTIIIILISRLMTYGTDAATSYLSHAYWYVDTCDMQPCDPTAETLTATTNRGFITRNKLSASKEVQLLGRLHCDLCNEPLYLVPGVRLQIRLTKARSSFYLMNKNFDSKAVFKFFDAQLLVRRIRPNSAILIAHNSTLSKGSITRYNLTRVENSRRLHSPPDQNPCLSTTPS